MSYSVQSPNKQINESRHFQQNGSSIGSSSGREYRPLSSSKSANVLQKDYVYVPSQPNIPSKLQSRIVSPEKNLIANQIDSIREKIGESIYKPDGYLTEPTDLSYYTSKLEEINKRLNYFKREPTEQEQSQVVWLLMCKYRSERNQARTDLDRIKSDVKNSAALEREKETKYKEETEKTRAITTNKIEAFQKQVTTLTQERDVMARKFDETEFALNQKTNAFNSSLLTNMALTQDIENQTTEISALKSKLEKSLNQAKSIHDLEGKISDLNKQVLDLITRKEIAEIQTEKMTHIIEGLKKKKRDFDEGFEEAMNNHSAHTPASPPTKKSRRP